MPYGVGHVGGNEVRVAFRKTVSEEPKTFCPTAHENPNPAYRYLYIDIHMYIYLYIDIDIYPIYRYKDIYTYIYIP